MGAALPAASMSGQNARKGLGFQLGRFLSSKRASGLRAAHNAILSLAGMNRPETAGHSPNPALDTMAGSTIHFISLSSLPTWLCAHTTTWRTAR